MKCCQNAQIKGNFKRLVNKALLSPPNVKFGSMKVLHEVSWCERRACRGQGKMEADEAVAVAPLEGSTQRVKRRRVTETRCSQLKLQQLARLFTFLHPAVGIPANPQMNAVHHLCSITVTAPFHWRSMNHNPGNPLARYWLSIISGAWLTKTHTRTPMFCFSLCAHALDLCPLCSTRTAPCSTWHWTLSVRTSRTLVQQLRRLLTWDTWTKKLTIPV